MAIQIRMLGQARVANGIALGRRNPNNVYPHHHHKNGILSKNFLFSAHIYFNLPAKGLKTLFP